ncbi:IclR family transcriptional regulator [Pseudoroseomonas ludipueritiae]|uniref:IclR family transcriptional regulator n=1 Tax=Pseudoroseomonas ludipueritiae TaxID=198093 RepID=A0ABR7R6A5_9PROT|nr:IclR family transcriptional regulator [Pseudoroseomonas ludipueritiae]MBC9177289.1 IclR family transcriptional regulator [Pseudoroseomonas ludipueritiae]MCG7361560.1 IclR family transcriptional regulator [Roseomonas sp. ACRSG]
MSEATPGKLVGAVVSGFKVVRHLARARGGMGVNQIARETDINPSTCFNILKTLVHERVVTFDPARKTYAIGLGFVEIAKGSLEKASFARLARPHLDAIATSFNVTVTAWQRTGDDRMVLVERADNDAATRVHMNLGQRLPLLIGAFGRCMAVYDPRPEAELREAFSTLRWQDPPSFEAWLQEVQAAQRMGYAIDADRYVRGVTTVASPVLEAEKRPVMAISAVGFSAQFTPVSLTGLAAAVKECADALSLAIAGEAPPVQQRIA